MRGSWIACVNVYLSVCDLLRMLRKPVIPTDLSSISRADRAISKANQSSHASRSDQAEVQADTRLHWVNGCGAAMIDPDEWFDDLDLDSPC